MNPSKLYRMLPLLPLLGACTHAPQKPVAVEHPPLERIAPEPKLDLPNVELTDRLLYGFLIGDVAAQRGRPELAAQAYLDLARTTRDPRVARRAAQLAFDAHQYEQSLEAFKLWRQLEPDSPIAKQMLLSLLLSGGKLEEARPLAVEVLARDDAPGRSFVTLYGLLARVQGKEAVLEWLDDIARPYPQVAEAHWALAQAANAAGRPERALTEAQRAYALRPEWDLAAMLDAQLLRVNDADAAVALMTRHLESYPDHGEARLYFARLLLELKRYEASRAQFAELLKQRPGNGELAFAIAMISLQLGELDRAEQELRQALASKGGDDATLHFYLGQMYEAKGDATAAMREYAAILAGERLFDARLRLAYLQYKQGDLKSARRTLAETPVQDEAQRVRLSMAEAQFLRDSAQHAEAYKVLSQELARQPEQPELLYQAALLADRLDKPKDFERLIRKLIEVEPDNAHAYNALGYGWLARNIRIKEAMALVQQAYKLAPDDAAIIDSMGWGYYRLGKLDKSLEFLRRAFAANPDPEIAAHLGEVLWAKGEHEAAQKVWRDSVQSHPDNELLREVMRKYPAR